MGKAATSPWHGLACLLKPHRTDSAWLCLTFQRRGVGKRKLLNQFPTAAYLSSFYCISLNNLSHEPSAGFCQESWSKEEEIVDLVRVQERELCKLSHASSCSSTTTLPAPHGQPIVRNSCVSTLCGLHPATMAARLNSGDIGEDARGRVT